MRRLLTAICAVLLSSFVFLRRLYLWFSRALFAGGSDNRVVLGRSNQQDLFVLKSTSKNGQGEGEEFAAVCARGATKSIPSYFFISMV